MFTSEQIYFVYPRAYGENCAIRRVLQDPGKSERAISIHLPVNQPGPLLKSNKTLFQSHLSRHRS